MEYIKGLTCTGKTTKLVEIGQNAIGENRSVMFMVGDETPTAIQNSFPISKRFTVVEMNAKSLADANNFDVVLIDSGIEYKPFGNIDSDVYVSIQLRRPQ